MSPDNKTPPRPGEGATGLRTGLEVLRTPTRSIFDILAAVESTQKSLPGKAKLEAQLAEIKPGPQMDTLRRKIRQLETASHMSEWLSSPGLQTPT